MEIKVSKIAVTAWGQIVRRWFRDGGHNIYACCGWEAETVPMSFSAVQYNHAVHLHHAILYNSLITIGVGFHMKIRGMETKMEPEVERIRC